MTDRLNLGVPDLSPGGYQMVRAITAATWIAEHLDTPLLDRLIAEADDERLWMAAASNFALSSGERLIVSWLAREVWTGSVWHEDVGWDRLVERVDDRLLTAVDDVTQTLRQAHPQEGV